MQYSLKFISDNFGLNSEQLITFARQSSKKYGIFEEEDVVYTTPYYSGKLVEDFKKYTFFNKIYDILVGIGGAMDIERDTFVYAHMAKEPCKEWRFRGLFGFGGKYRSEKNTVDCYREDETPELLEVIIKINLELKKLC